MTHKDKFIDIPIEDMDMLELCDELGITTEDIIERFKERVYAYQKSLDEWGEWYNEFDDERDDPPPWEGEDEFAGEKE